MECGPHSGEGKGKRGEGVGGKRREWGGGGGGIIVGMFGALKVQARGHPPSSLPPPPPPRLMWLAGILAALSSIIYPAISAMVSKNAEPEQQGVVLGILTGTCSILILLCMHMDNQVHRVLFRKEGEGKERERKKITTTSTT